MKRLNNLFLLLLASLVLMGCQQEKADPAPKQENKPSADKEDTSFSADDKVVTIDGKVLTYEDLQFHELMNKAEIELNRQQDEQKLKGAELEDKLAYWDEQLQYYDNFNVNLSKMIEQYSMYLLAKEKGLNVTDDEVKKAIGEFEEKVQQYGPASELVKAYPEDAYQNRLKRYFTEKLLTVKIYETLETDVKREKPNAPEKEIAYDTTKKYEELYQSQIGSLDLKIDAAGK